MPERREIRFTLAADVLTEDEQTRAQRAGKVENISRSGCFIRSKDPWMQWTIIRIWVMYRGQQFEAFGSVVHTAGGKGMGISFDQIPPTSLELLEAWMASLPS